MDTKDETPLSILSCMPIDMSDHRTAAHISDTSVSVSLYNNIQSVPQADWMRFAEGHHPLLQPSYLKLLEDTVTDMQFIYAVLRQDEGLIGICYFQIVKFCGDNLIAYYPKEDGSVKSKLLGLTKSFVARIEIPLLVSGNLFITGEQGVSLLPHFTELERSFYLSHTIDHILKERKDIKTVLLPDMYEPKGDFDTAFLVNKYQRIYVEADMSMELSADWHHFEDYLGAITSKYRVRAKKILSTSHELTSHELNADELEADLDRFFELYTAVADKADFNIAKLPKAYYPQQMRQAPDMYKVFAYYLEGTMVGFMSLFILPYKLKYTTAE